MVQPSVPASFLIINLHFPLSQVLLFPVCTVLDSKFHSFNKARLKQLHITGIIVKRQTVISLEGSPLRMQVPPFRLKKINISVPHLCNRSSTLR